jgi:hypothetical protein
MYWKDKEKDTFEKFIDKNINSKPEDISQYDYHRMYLFLKERFCEVEFLTFEGFINNPVGFYDSVSKILFGEGGEFIKVDNNKRNTKVILPNGVYSKPVSFFHYIKSLVPSIIRRKVKFHIESRSMLMKVYDKFSYALSKYDFKKPTVMESMTDSQVLCIRRYFKESNRSISELLNIDISDYYHE